MSTHTSSTADSFKENNHYLLRGVALVGLLGFVYVLADNNHSHFRRELSEKSSKFIERYDLDKNGKMSASEFETACMDSARNSFRSLDSDSNSTLDSTELKRYFSQ